jgi:hypothetical protein
MAMAGLMTLCCGNVLAIAAPPAKESELKKYKTVKQELARAARQLEDDRARMLRQEVRVDRRAMMAEMTGDAADIRSFRESLNELRRMQDTVEMLEFRVSEIRVRISSVKKHSAGTRNVNIIMEV